MKQIQTTPVALAVGDRVLTYGAVVQVEYIHTYMSDGEKVAACYSRLISENAGAIPLCWFETPAQLSARGCTKLAANLPDGRYWNVQGNRFASVTKLVEA